MTEGKDETAEVVFHVIWITMVVTVVFIAGVKSGETRSDHRHICAEIYGRASNETDSLKIALDDRVCADMLVKGR